MRPTLQEKKGISPSQLYLTSHTTLFISHSTSQIHQPAAMVFFRGIKASVLRYGIDRPYQEYEPKQKSSETCQNEKEAYIEAVTNERFCVVVELTEKFNFNSSPDVKISCWIDGGDGYANYVSKEDHCKNIQGSKKRFDSIKRLIDGKWIECGMTFGELQLGTYL